MFLRSLCILLLLHNIVASSHSVLELEQEETISTLAAGIIIALALFSGILICCWWSEKNNTKHSHANYATMGAELCLLEKKNINLQCSLKTMEEAYTSLLEKYQPEDLQPLLQAPESKLFWVVKPSP